MTEEENSHKGHRSRLKDLLEKNGLDSLTKSQILEYLLFHGIPYHDTKPIADALLAKFGSLYGVLSAPYSSLLDVKGMTADAALFLSTLLGVYSQTQRKKIENTVIASATAVVPFLRTVSTLNHAEAFIICLDDTFHVICVEKIGEDSGKQVVIETKELVEIAIRNRAKKLILARNRPTDYSTPTTSDIIDTMRLQNYLATIQIELLDHIVIGNSAVYSMSKARNVL